MSSTSNAAPSFNVTQIPLPPGMDLAEFQDFQVSIHLLSLSVVGDSTSSRDRHHYICCVWYCCVGLVSSLNYIHGLD